MANEAGGGCVERSNLGGLTWVSKGAPASIGGSVNRLAAFITGGSGGTLDFAFFEVVSGNNLSTIAGTVVQGLAYTGEGCKEFLAPGDFTAFAISAGKYLGAYAGDGNINFATSGGNDIWRNSGDYIPCTDQGFTLSSSWIDSLAADIAAAGGLSIPVAQRTYRNRRAN